MKGDIEMGTAAIRSTATALVEAGRSTQGTLSSRMDSLTDLVPVSRAEFAAEIVPCLSLTSGVGMQSEDQRVWLNAAYKALDGIPIKLLKRGAAAAMLKADHPAKIVPAIRAEIEEEWAWRRKHNRPVEIHLPEAALPAPGQERITPEEASAICKRYGVGSFSPHRESDPA